jgi:hypothetical protein
MSVTPHLVTLMQNVETPQARLNASVATGSPETALSAAISMSACRNRATNTRHVTTHVELTFVNVSQVSRVTKQFVQI